MTLDPYCAAALSNRTKPNTKGLPLGRPFVMHPARIAPWVPCRDGHTLFARVNTTGQGKERNGTGSPPAPCKNSKKALLKRRAFSFNFVLLLSAAAQYGCPDTGLARQHRSTGANSAYSLQRVLAVAARHRHGTAAKKRWPSISKQKVRLFSNQEAVLAAVYWGA